MVFSQGPEDAPGAAPLREPLRESPACRGSRSVLVTSTKGRYHKARLARRTDFGSAASRPSSKTADVIPLKNENPTRSAPVVTVGLIAINVLAYIWQASLGPDEQYGILRWGLTPQELRGVVTYAHGGFSPQPVVTVFTSMFLHGHLLHLAGNMLFLWIFGDNVEETLGHLRFILFYFATGVAGSLTQVFTSADPTVAMIGASGAISGVLGAYLVLYPLARIVTLVPLFFYFTIVRVPAFVFIIFWFALQLLGGVASSGDAGGGIAFLAHIGGFVAGAVLILPRARNFRRRRILRLH